MKASLSYPKPSHQCLKKMLRGFSLCWSTAFRLREPGMATDVRAAMLGATTNPNVPARASSEGLTCPTLELTDSPTFSTKFKGQELVLPSSGNLIPPGLFPSYFPHPPTPLNCPHVPTKPLYPLAPNEAELHGGVHARLPNKGARLPTCQTLPLPRPKVILLREATIGEATPHLHNRKWRMWPASSLPSPPQESWNPAPNILYALTSFLWGPQGNREVTQDSGPRSCLPRDSPQAEPKTITSSQLLRGPGGGTDPLPAV